MISVRMTTPQRKRIDASRSFSIISMLRLALAEFGFEQERALGRDDGPAVQPIDDLDPSTAALAGDNIGRLKALGGFDEHDFVALRRSAPLLRAARSRRYRRRRAA
jgi:hypothetical protein